LKYFKLYFYTQLVVQILTDIAAVFAGMKKLACLNDTKNVENKCEMTDTL